LANRYGLAHSWGMEPQRRPRPRLIQKLEARRAEHRRRGRVYRAVFAIAGTLVLLGGVVMLITPGPAFVLIPIGLAMLSLEFAWAERLLERSLEQAHIAQEKAAQTTRAQRILGGLAFVAGAGALIAAQFYWDLIGFLPH
jgi:uncharacterized protein (TIGR02611 family)